mmetsp:Transcript_16753/g.33518  ORF Transcript_16753/g.33518 Transcript_16753/m.33518 type:complete len:89 (-) Transcript_16753:243-509(-)
MLWDSPCANRFRNRSIPVTFHESWFTAARCSLLLSSSISHSHIEGNATILAIGGSFVAPLLFRHQVHIAHLTATPCSSSGIFCSGTLC